MKVEYALRAMRWLCSAPRGSLLRVGSIAEKEKIPACFLAKILKKLAKAKILVSSRGRMGGYALGCSPKQITLEKIVEVLEGLDSLSRCVVGWAKCLDEQPCSLHRRFKPIRKKVCRYLKSTTVENLVLADKSKKSAGRA